MSIQIFCFISHTISTNIFCNARALHPELANKSNVDFVLGSSTSLGIETDAEGRHVFSNTHARRLRIDTANVFVTPVFSGPIGDPNAHFALAIANTNPDVVYTYDSLEDSDLPATILECVKCASGSSTLTAEPIGVNEKQRGAWECGYFVFRRQFITLMVMLAAIDPSGIMHPFRVTDEWVRTILKTFHENVAFETREGESMFDAIKKFVNITFFPVNHIKNHCSV